MDVAVAGRAGRPAWINRRTVFGVLLVALSVAGGHAILESGKATTPMWVAARDLAGGSTVSAYAVRVEHVHLPPSLASSYAAADHPIEGQVVTRPVSEGELLSFDWLAVRAPGEGRALTVPVDPEHAVGGDLHPGDLVDIFATFDAGDPSARTVTLAREVQVVDLVTAGGLVMGDKAVVGITVSVSPEDAQRIALAARTGELDVARVDDPSQRGARGLVRSADL